MLYENKVKFLFLTFLFVISCSHTICSQYVNTFPNNSTIYVISDISTYNASIKKNNCKKMVNLKDYLNPLFTDFKYATINNFTQSVLYNNPDAFVRLKVAIALKHSEEELAAKGLALKIFDAYRPYSVTKKMWAIVPDERYAANPAKGSGHNRGIAVDVTLVKITSGEELAMPTGFDDFSERAHHNYMNLPQNVLQNRELLKTTMENNGFQALSNEWWHYSLANTETNFELLDLTFQQLKQVEDGQ